MAKIFTGFSTSASTQEQSFKLYDLELVKCDLLNHFHTRIGERVMRPEYGCRIWNYLMEPFTDLVRGSIIEEARRICESDSRVQIVSLNASSTDNAIRVEMTLNFRPFDVVDNFMVEFENRQSEQGF